MNKTSIIIRPVIEKDMLTVYELICELEEKQFNINDFEAIFIRNINDKNVYYYLAEHETGKVLGFISGHIQYLLHHCNKVAEIQELFVKEEYRNCGIGLKLIQHLETNIQILNCDSFEVTAQNKRVQTHEFYKKVGFTQSHLKFIKKI